VGQNFCSPWSSILQVSLRSPTSFRPGIIPTLHPNEPNVESQHSSTRAMSFAQCDGFAALGFRFASLAIGIFRKSLEKCWDPVGMQYPERHGQGMWPGLGRRLQWTTQRACGRLRVWRTSREMRPLRLEEKPRMPTSVRTISALSLWWLFTEPLSLLQPRG
jgi:hypothetical protein